MEFDFNDTKKFVCLNEGERILYFFDKKRIVVRMLNTASGTNKNIKDAEVISIAHGHYLIQFTTAQYQFRYELYRGKLMATANQKVELHPKKAEEPAPSAGEIVEAMITTPEVKEVEELTGNEFYFNINLKTIDFTDHFYDRVKQRLQREDNIISEIAYESDALFRNEAQGWIMKALLTMKPQDLVVANKITYIGNTRKKVWTVSVIIGKYTVVIESYPERTKIVSFMDRSKTQIHMTK